MSHFLKTISVVAASLLTVFTIGGCADDETTGDNFRLQAEMTSSTVSRTYMGKSTPTAGDTVESLTVTSVRVLIRDLKLKYKDSVTEAKIKTGPLVLSVTSAGPQISVNSFIPSGVYDKVHMKIHRLNNDEADDVAGDPVFADFISPERTSIIFEGTMLRNGATVPFVYKSKIDEDMKFETVEFSVSGGMTVLALNFDMPLIFKDKDTGAILDPTDPDNESDIDKGIKSALKIIKKQQ
jgi:hypothetical protein